MRAIVVETLGGPEVMKFVEQPEPSPLPGHLVVEVSAIGVNFIDTYHRCGVYPMPTPFTPGLEGAGRVVAVGAGATRFAPGDRVAWKSAPGSYATMVHVPQSEAVPVPDGVSDEVVAAAMLQGMTAHFLSHSAYPVQSGDIALVHAAAGGVGLLLTQMVKMRGGRVFATVSTPEKAELARGAGADEILAYEDVPTRVRELTGGEGVAVVYDGVGKATFDASLASLRVRGYMVLFGGSSGQVPPFDPQRLNAGGGLYLTRPLLAHYTRTRDELLERANDLFSWIADGKLEVRIGARYPLAEASKAHEDLESRKTTGKLLLIP